jgi:hypothetical protein
VDREAQAVRAQEAELAAQLAADRRALDDAVTARTDAEAALAAEERVARRCAPRGRRPA